MRTYLDLVNVRRPDSGELLELLDMADAEVADADAPGMALVVQALEGLPHFAAGLGAAAGAVDEEQVDDTAVLGVELAHALQALGVAGVDGAGGAQDLGRQEHVLPRYPGLAHRLPDLGLVAVVLRRVNVPVPVPQRREARLHALLRRRLVHAEAQLRDVVLGQEPKLVGDGALGHGDCLLDLYVLLTRVSSPVRPDASQSVDALSTLCTYLPGCELSVVWPSRSLVGGGTCRGLARGTHAKSMTSSDH